MIPRYESLKPVKGRPGGGGGVGLSKPKQTEGEKIANLGDESYFTFNILFSSRFEFVLFFPRQDCRINYLKSR